MTENEYILVTNKTAVVSAQETLRHVLSGPEWGVDEKEFHKVMNMLSMMNDKLFSAIDTTGQ